MTTDVKGGDPVVRVDGRLVDELARGDRAALAAIHDGHSGAVRALAGRLCGAEHADDVAQEVFLRLWRRPEAYDPDRGTLRAYLLTMTRGRSIDALRNAAARRARERTTVREPAADPTARLDGEVWRLLQDLPAKDRTAIALAFYAGHSYRAVAAILGEPEGTVKSRIRSGLLRLRTQLEGAETERAT